MRTARTLTVSPSMLCAGGVSSEGGGSPPGDLLWGVSSRRGIVVSQHALRQTPSPVNRMTNRCKNITFPRTSFAGGKYEFYLVFVDTWYLIRHIMCNLVCHFYWSSSFLLFILGKLVFFFMSLLIRLFWTFGDGCSGFQSYIRVFP